MNRLGDEYIASAMRAMGSRHGPPADALQQIVAKANRRHRIGRAVGLAVATAGVAFAVAAAAAVLPINQAADSVPASSTGTSAQTDWQRLTGKELGEALGWTAVPTDGPYCDGTFAEYVDGRGFCYTVADLQGAGIPATTRVDRLVFGFQIGGIERSPQLVEWVQLRQEQMRMLGSASFDADRYNQIHDRLDVLRREVFTDRRSKP